MSNVHSNPLIIGIIPLPPIDFDLLSAPYSPKVVKYITCFFYSNISARKCQTVHFASLLHATVFVHFGTNRTPFYLLQEIVLNTEEIRDLVKHPLTKAQRVYRCALPATIENTIRCTAMLIIHEKRLPVTSFEYTPYSRQWFVR